MPKSMPSVDDLREVFANADKDGGGKLTIEQFLYAIAKFEGCDTEEEKKLFSENKEMQDRMLLMTDFDGDKLITFDEVKTFFDAMNCGNYEEQMMKMIRACDTDDDGFLTANELKLAIMKVMPLKKEADAEKKVERFINMGSDFAEKKLRVEEAIKLLLGKALYDDPKEVAKTMFRMIDTNQDGFVTKKELASYITIFDGDVMKMLVGASVAEADKDGDGKLNYDEFCDWMETNEFMLQDLSDSSDSD